MAFSGAVKLSNLSDFISPSQACVVNLKGGKLSADEGEQAGLVQLQPLRGAAGPVRTPALPPTAGPVKVSLHDCLACSGCITSAETVLLEQQSSAELLSKLADPAVAVVVSVSPQSRAALAAALGVSPLAAARLLCGLFASLGARACVDTSVSRELALLEAGAELVARLRGGAGPLPVLASACPGWVCYAEKRHGAAVLPHLSAVKSPQAVMGTLVKRLWAQRAGVAPAAVYHASVAPCADKKLEAARGELRTAAGDGDDPAAATATAAAPETDCVLTTAEVLQELLRDRGADCDALAAAVPLDPAWHAVGGAAADALWGAPGGGAGGYAEAAARAAARELWGAALPPGPLPWRALRNADFREAILQPPPDVPPGTRPLRFAAVYGFHNIQTLVRQLKRPGGCEYDYVEVMACPAGCLNGGGQPRPLPGQARLDVLAAVEAAYSPAAGVAEREPGSHPLVADVYALLGGGPGSAPARAALHTSFSTPREAPPTVQLNNW